MLHSTGRISEYIAECARLNIAILPPDVGKSGKYFTVEEGGIRFSLLAIKNLGEGFIDAILRERENAAYTGLYEFCDRLYGRDMNRRALEGLIKSGALDSLCKNRNQALEALDSLLGLVKEAAQYREGGQLGLFDTPGTKQEFRLPDVPDMPVSQKLSLEKETTGMYLSGHPMQEYREVVKRLGTARSVDILEAGQSGSRFSDNDRAGIVGIVGDVRMKSTRNNATMAYVTLEDFYSEIEVIVFPKTLSEHGMRLVPGQVVRIDGRIALREDREAQLICESVSAVDKNAAGPAAERKRPASGAKPGLYLRVRALESAEWARAGNILALFEGDVPLCVVTTENGKRLLASREQWVSPNAPMLRELANVLGEENVRLVE